MRTIVIGAGIAGLTAAVRLLEAGEQVTLVSKGPGGMQLSQGTVDVLGYAPDRVRRPFERLGGLPASHPYATLGADRVRTATTWLRDRLGLFGTGERNLQLPTAIGAIRPTAYAPASMAAADAGEHRSFAVVGVREIKDFPSELLAGNLARTELDGERLRASHAVIEFEARPGEHDPATVHFAGALDDPEVCERFAKAVAAAAGEGDVVLLPGVLGLHDPTVHARVAEIVGRPVSEVAMQPPSVPGLRMFQQLLDQARGLGLRHVQGAKAVGFTAEGDRVTGITVASAGRDRTIACDAVVHAPGGFESGALEVDSHGAIRETLFGLPTTADRIDGLVTQDWFVPQPLFAVGVQADAAMGPVGSDLTNLHVAGGILAGAHRQQEKSGDGIAVASAFAAADSILEGRQ